jgi:hypothetical protein
MFGLAALAALLAMAFVGASSAMAEKTTLCSTDESPCEIANVISHVHETSVGKAKLLSSLLNVECDVLFLGDTVAKTSAPLVIEGSFTYSNCNNSCTATEENGPAEIEVLKEGHEKSKVTGEGLVHLVCGAFINCRYNGEGLIGTGKGPLLSAQANGEVSISEAETNKESGSLCPSTAKLDITTTPLTPVYLGGQTLGHYCVKYERTIGFYLNVNGSKKSECIEKDTKRLGRYGLVVGRAGLTAGAMVCVDLNEKVGLYKKISANGEKCEENDVTNSSLYELAEIQ